MQNAIVNHKHIVVILSVILLVLGVQSMSYGQVLKASSAQPLTEATLNESVVTLTLRGGTYERSKIDIGNALSVSGIAGVRIGTFGPAWFGVDRVSGTQITVELGFNGNMEMDATLIFTLGADAITNYNGPPLTAEIPVTGEQESLIASTKAPLTEATLDGSVVILTLNGATYARSIFDIRDAVSVSGIDGVTIPWHDPDKNSDTQITMKLEFDGDIDADSTLTFTVGADAIANYNGPPLTAEIPVTGEQESLIASTKSPLTEATLDGSVVILTLNGATYARSIFGIRDAVSVSGIDGVTIPWHDPDKNSDTQITMKLEFDGDIDADSTLTFTVGADAIANYNGPPLTAEIPVSASTETPEQPDVGDTQQPIASIGDTQQPIASKETEVPERDSSQDFIEGPWLWMVVPTDPAVGNGISTEIDSLADASGGAVTEAGVAQNGVSEGDSIGQLRWISSEIHWSKHQCRKYSVTREPNIFLAILTLGLLQDECIDPTVCWADNISNVANTLGMGTELESGARTAYALVNLVSPREQRDVILKAKSGDAMKIWLNGNVVHREAAERYGQRKINVPLACDPTVDVSDPALQESDVSSIPVTLNAGNNLLFVKVRQHGAYWGMRVQLDADFTTEIATSTTRITPPIAANDVNGDGVVDVQDLVFVAQRYGQTGPTTADVNGDGIVNVDDFILVAAAIDAAAAAAPAARAQMQPHFTAAQLQTLLTEARASGNTSHRYQKGIAFLEHLLAVLTPEETALLANYPNPFNPETWIPYQLSKSADVTLTIYGLNGQVVRHLPLGHQAAGLYQSRSRAAYWDGRNAFGEPVASGLYFYTLTAGDFSATRKMLIRK